MTRDEIRQRFASVSKLYTPETDEQDKETVNDYWTEQRVAAVLQKILEENWDRFKFLGWL